MKEILHFTEMSDAWSIRPDSKTLLTILSYNTWQEAMAITRLIAPLRRALISSSKSVTQNNPSPLSLPSPLSIFITRSYISAEIYKPASQPNILGLIRNEIQYEIDHFNPKQVLSSFPFPPSSLSLPESLRKIIIILGIQLKNQEKPTYELNSSKIFYYLKSKTI